MSYRHTMHLPKKVAAVCNQIKLITFLKIIAWKNAATYLTVANRYLPDSQTK